MTLTNGLFVRCLQLTATSAIGDKHVLAFTDGLSLFDLLTESSLMKKSGTCFGAGTCGKCRIKVISGMMPEPMDDEKEIMGDVPSSVRISCKIKLDSESSGAYIRVL